MEGRAGGKSPREQKLSERDIDCRVHVFGYPPYTQPQDLTRAFLHFGTLRVEKMNTKHATLVFPTSYDARTALEASRKVSIYGTLLTVKPFDPAMTTEQKKSPRKEKKKRQILSTIDPKKIDLSGNFHKQLDNILNIVRLTQEEVTAMSSLYADLEKVLQALWPGCSAIPFGSIPTGLGIKSSDADCFVSIPPQFKTPLGNYVNKAKKILQNYPNIFDELVAIPRANTPIVKLVHVPTRTACDLTFKTELGARNSRLIAFLLHADPRLLPLAVVIKYWARVHELSGSGRLTNYALTMLIIFYLQQPPLSILPSVQWLQSGVQEEIVDYWNVAFDGRRENMPPINNKSSLSELIGGFFQFYSTFNFDEMIACPYLGYPVKKDSLKDLEKLPPGFERYRENILHHEMLAMRFNTSICVQDPFEQCHNVASTISSRLADELRAYFKFAANAYEQESPKNCKGFFEIILLQKPKLPKNKGSPEFRANLFPNMIANIVAPDWKAVVRKVVFEIFETMLKIKLGKVEEKVNPDSKKEKEKYMGVVCKAIWKRKQFSRLYTYMNLDFVQRNIKITEEILNAEKELLNINFQMTVTFCHEPRSSVVSIKMSSGDVTAFREFGKFFVSVLQHWFVQLMKPYTQWPERDTATKIAETIKYLDNNLDDDDDDSDDSVLSESAQEAGAAAASSAAP
ncbi:speckle targeted PIP5K1A-regulated poly(A) polymerase [Amyelois transitella]|uniref:speckle targeted PIP5K1A-regulated poly(A) polymerase n=1 Tax=Amyelois transitella TaxID=680683 RepID=UPI00298F9EBA|nr:speckle targeted PIP5K1A-regulated poly(A) polymerase [Amyelois transitella]XP_013194362.2 speckle targeted PIP5K1A-regulated poly(A) polymerase [Amyelois transitella]XP_013194363.2 speckle targeted PIP5K1A-regulated poly(A) polymerase [Amyelois transitella]XP_060804108.1 speckle targeted PIP5K1A-regulated poly(A) polymerase [Amyelois transitella]